MLHFKLLLLSFYCLQVVWTASVESFNSNELDKSVPLSSEEEAPKVNWLPICQQLQVNEPETNIVTPESNIVYLPQDIPGIVISPVRTTASSDDVCEAPNGLGLKNLLKESKALIPYDRLKSIVLAAAQDPEVQRIKKLLTSNDFRAKVHEFVETRHFIILRNYVCRALNLDMKYYVKFVRSLFALEKLEEPQEANKNCKGRAGIKGLIQDLNEALPKQQLRDLYVRLLISDEQLITAVRRIKSDEFRQLLHNLTTLKEYNELKDMLVQSGIPLQGVKEFVDSALGWQGDELENQASEKI